MIVSAVYPVQKKAIRRLNRPVEPHKRSRRDGLTRRHTNLKPVNVVTMAK